MTAKETLITNNIDLKKMIEDDHLAITKIAAIMEAYHTQKMLRYSENGQRVIIAHPDNINYSVIDENGSEEFFYLVKKPCKCSGNFFDTHQEMAKENYLDKNGDIQTCVVLDGEKKIYYAPIENLPIVEFDIDSTIKEEDISKSKRDYVKAHPNSKEKINFHAACIPCGDPEKDGVRVCLNCKFFDFWNNPSIEKDDDCPIDLSGDSKIIEEGSHCDHVARSPVINGKYRCYTCDELIAENLPNCLCGISIHDRTMEEIGTCTCSKCGDRC